MYGITNKKHSSNLPLITIVTLSSSFSNLVYMKALGMLPVATYISSIALITDVTNTHSNLSVGIAASYF